jgi:hypothetical protein
MLTRCLGTFFTLLRSRDERPVPGAPGLSALAPELFQAHNSTPRFERIGTNACIEIQFRKTQGVFEHNAEVIL